MLVNKTIAVYPVDAIISFVSGNTKKCKKFKFAGRKVRINSLKLQTFKKDGLVCADCGIQASFFSLDTIKHKSQTRTTLNLYAWHDGQLKLMTCDHIIPKSKGGGKGIANTQTMCYACNHKKGNNYEQHTNYQS